MKILITGGFGNLGSWLTRGLLSEGHTVSVLTRSACTIPELSSAHVIQANLTDPVAIKTALCGREFEAVVHTASYNEHADPEYYWKSYRVNTEGTRTLLQHLDSTRLRHFIYFSTFHVYGVSSGRISEDTTPFPRNDYAASHLAAEIIVQQAHLSRNVPYTILRLTNSYGCPLSRHTPQWSLILNDLARMAVRDSVIRLTSDGMAYRDFIWMGDVCRAVSHLLTRHTAQNRIFNLSFGKSMRLLEIAQNVADAFAVYSGRSLNIETANRSTCSVQPSLEVASDLIWRLLDWYPQHHLHEEAINIFRYCSS